MSVVPHQLFLGVPYEHLVLGAGHARVSAEDLILERHPVQLLHLRDAEFITQKKKRHGGVAQRKRASCSEPKQRCLSLPTPYINPSELPVNPV